MSKHALVSATFYHFVLLGIVETDTNVVVYDKLKKI